MRGEGVPIAIAVALCIACSTVPPPPPPSESVYWQRMGQLCGEVQLEAATRKTIRTQEGKIEERLYETPLANAKIVLYKAEDLSIDCCSKARRIAETVSDRHGRFEFNGNPAGQYWLVVDMKDREVQVPVIAEAYSKESCEARYVGRIITVDAMPHPKVEVRIY